MKRKPDPIKTCESCGNKMTRKYYGNHLEDMGAFVRRKFCSLSCANTRETEGLTKHGYSFRARKHLKKACEACGYTKSLHAHHVDQDKTNNEPENIQTLCKHCHNFWHTTQKRMGKEIAGRMPSLDIGNLSQTSGEFQMAFPIGWANSKAMETHKSRSKPQQHSSCSTDKEAA